MTPQALADALLAVADPTAQQAWLDDHAADLDMRLIEELKAHTDQNLLRDPQTAQRSAQVALVVAARLSDPLATALAQWAYGNAAIYLGDYVTCLDLYRAAATAYLARDHRMEAARLRTNAVFALTNLGRYAEALVEANIARTELEQYGATHFLALLEQNVGVACHHLGSQEQALAAYARARTIFVAQNDPVKAAEMDVNTARVAMYMDDFERATVLLTAARPVFADHDQAMTVARTDLNLGTLWARQGRFNASLDAYARARRTFAELGNPMEMAVVDLYCSSVFLALNLYPEAIELATTAAAVLGQRQMVRQAALATANQGAAQRGLGNLTDANALLGKARAIWDELGVELEAALLDLERASLWRALGWLQPALQLLEQALAVLDRCGMPLRRTQALLLMAECQFDLGRAREAGQLFQQALDRLEGQDLSILTYRGNYGLGRVAEAERHPDKARLHYAAAVAALDALQASLLVDELRAAFLDDKQAAYQDYVHILLTQGAVEEALTVVGHAKAGVLVDAIAASLADRFPGADGDANWEELQRLRAEWQWQLGKLRAGSELGEATKVQDDGTVRANGTAAGVALHQIEARSRDLWWEVQQRRRHGVSPFTPGVSALADLQAGLPNDALRVEYFAHEDRLLAFVVGTHGVHVVTDFPAPLSEIERSMAVLELTLKSVGNPSALPTMELACQRHLGWFYQAVLQPLAHLLAGCRRLIVAPFGPLHYLPFAALHDGRCYLVETMEVVCLAAPTPADGDRHRTFAAASSGERRKPTDAGMPGDAALVVGCTSAGRLPHVEAEVTAVAANLPQALVLTGEAATLARLQQECAGRRLLHLAAHGVFRGDNPLFSYLELADGPLRLLDIYGLRLDADLVVLSACETGVRQARGGDLVGLCRGFLTAGARHLVVSLWRVDDAATAELMAGFYGNLAQGMKVAASLRAAQLALLTQQPHPYYWAPFVVIET